MCKAVTSEAVCAAAKRVFTRREVYETRPDLMIIKGGVYSAEKFRWVHPGGALFVSMFGGRDATLAFQSYHMREFPEKRMEEYLEGYLAESETAVEEDKEHLELAAEVKKALGPTGTFAPRFQIFKAVLLLAIAFFVEARALVQGRTWAASAVLGVLFALIGLNVQHDANHGAMFKSGQWNAVFGLAQAWIGGSQLMWIQEHVVLHHLHTGDREMDPDAQLAPAMRGHTEAPWYPWMMFQKLYLLILEAGYAAVPIFMAPAEVAVWRHKFEAKYALSPLAKPWAIASFLGHALFYTRFFVLPLYLASKRGEGLIGETLKIAVTLAAGGFYLAFFFFLSHNFDGVHFEVGAQPDGSAVYPENSSFLKQQINSSSNVAGAGLCLVNGGLNYQIEHHLFPRIAHSHYPRIAPVVKAFVQSRNLAVYTHFPTVTSNLLSVFNYLDHTGARPVDSPSYKKSL